MKTHYVSNAFSIIRKGVKTKSQTIIELLVISNYFCFLIKSTISKTKLVVNFLLGSL